MFWLILLLAMLLIVLTATYLLFRFVFYAPLPHPEKIYDIPSGEQYQVRRELMTDLIRQMDEIPYESVTVTAFDGTELFARYYHVADGAPLQIQMHGYRGSAIRDFCGGNKLAREMGFNTLVPDERAHGRSGGTVITFGLRERYDCLTWIQYAQKRFGPDTPIVLAGVSMGAATVLMTAGLDLPEAVKGIIADCPYSSPVDIIKKVGGDMHLPVKLCYPLIVLGARLFGHFDIRETTGAKEIRKAKVPLLIIHGEDDLFVPCDMSLEPYQVCPTPKMRVTVPGAGHAISYIVDPETYEKAVQDFLSMLSLP